MNETASPRTKNVLPVISFVTFIGFLDTHLLIPVMALYAYELGAGIGIVGLIVGLYSIINTPANVLLGRLVDRVGYRLPLVAGLIGDAVSMFLYTLCRLPFHLALVRALHGITGGMVGPSTMSAIAYHGGEERRGRVMAVYGMSLAAATLVGYGLSGFIASRLGYKVVFWLGGGLLIIGAALALLLPGTKIRQEDTPKTSAGEGWRKAKELLKRKGLISPYCTIFAQYFSFGGVVTLLPLYLKDRGMEAFHMGILLAVFAVLFIILQVPVGNLSDRFGRVGLAIAGLALGIVALVLLPWMTAFPLLIAVMALYGVAYGMIFPSVSAMVADHTDPGERGLGTGIFHALLTAGVAIGAPVIGWAGGVVGVESGLILSAAAMVLAFVVTLAVSKQA
ncbi:MAG: MFS transporter [Dehalococcoidales bacterium]|nr:MFS transporter [Dehalococcoidales bacterium]